MPNDKKIEESSEEEIIPDPLGEDLDQGSLEPSRETIHLSKTVEEHSDDSDEEILVSITETESAAETNAEQGVEPSPAKETIRLEEQEPAVSNDVPQAGTQPPVPPTPVQFTPPAPLSPTDERTWAMLAHLSILLNLVTGFLGPLVALGIYLIYKDRSRYVAYQSMQSFIFQLIWWVGGGVLAGLTWAISGVLTMVIIGCCLMPIALFLTIIPIAALVYGVVGAVQTNQGLDFKYWLIGDWVRSTYTSD